MSRKSSAFVLGRLCEGGETLGMRTAGMFLTVRGAGRLALGKGVPRTTNRMWSSSAIPSTYWLNYDVGVNIPVNLVYQIPAMAPFSLS